MNEPSLDEATRDYFRQVMDEWQAGMHSGTHPYADNPTWQKHFAALQSWVRDCSLENGRVLEVGCGTGLLQDAVADYVGIDIADKSAQYMRKPFAVSSAEDLPFPDNHFDGVWSFWVLEHLASPEKMLSEIRRVLKPGGTLFLVAAYAVGSWVSQGIHKRPYAELTTRQCLTKLTLPIRSSTLFKAVASVPRRLTQLGSYAVTRQPSTLQYRQLSPNYQTYWDYDADACASLDSFSVALYFLSRGDKPVYDESIVLALAKRSQAQAYIVSK